MVDIVNAAPMVIDLGTEDKSTRVLPLSSLNIPQHLPKIYIFAEKGPVGPTYVDLDSVSLTQLYGDDTFDVNKKYYTHQTVFLQGIVSGGNNVVVHRLVAPDAKDVANVALYLDVLPVQVPLYQKNSDGSLILDSNGNPVPQLDSNNDPILVNGFKVAWIIDKTITNIGNYSRGLLTQRAGLQVNGTIQSTQYPIFEFAAKDPGEFGNKLAIRLYSALKSDIIPFPSNILSESKAYPYYFQLVKVTDTISGKVQPVLNSFGSQYAKIILKNRGIDPASGAIIDITKIVTDQYINLPESTATGLGTVYVYNDNLENLLQQFYNSEKVITDTHRDSVINNTENNIHALNIISFTSSNGSPYQSIKPVNITNSIRLTKNTNVFLSGSSDGTISNSLLDTLVSEDLENYNNSLHEYNDLVLHPESMIYDSGFSLQVKRNMPKFISRRKDTFIMLSTYAWNAPSTDLATQFSVATALKTMLQLYPESATFGTPVMRGVLFCGSGELIDSLYIDRVPLTYEVAYKSARYMGAKNGKWKNGFIFDKAPGSIITQLKNIDITWVPASTRNTLWSVGINFALNYQIRRQFFPAIQTVYENDTSVLNSYFTAVAISFLNKIAHAAWREFSGTISYTNAQLEEAVNNFVAEQVKDRFDDKFVVIPNCHVTEFDALRGYSWTLQIKLYSPNMKTVMSTYVSAFRTEDLGG